MKTVFVSGAFNVLHPGHNRLLKFAKSLGNKLIVGVVSDSNLDKNIYVNILSKPIKNILEIEIINRYEGD